ncbi:phytanoyl-CoA dioxygenase family protein [bacterium AH-315-I18]|nr:phytanoyl-CoA dioxygenase family protein [bacterium AH-315-I18]
MTRTIEQIITPQQIKDYRTHGFVHIPNIITTQEAGLYHQAALEATEQRASLHEGSIFKQHVNNWQHNDVIKKLTLHPTVAAAAQTLAGVALRLWHDHTLIKMPRNSTPTEFHQDQPYWPHENSFAPLSAWIALCDVPVECGCMTFIPGSQDQTQLPAQNLADPKSLFELCPKLQWEPRVTVPLKAGDCTFHHGRCAHMATPNITDDPRVAHVIIFIDQETTYAGTPHVVTDPLNLKAGHTLDHPLFPTVQQILDGKVESFNSHKKGRVDDNHPQCTTTI